MLGAGSCPTAWLATSTTGVFTAVRITGALLGPRCKLRRRLVPALALLTRFARRCRQPKLPGSAGGVAVLIVAATLTAVPVPGTALALGPLGTGKGGEVQQTLIFTITTDTFTEVDRNVYPDGEVETNTRSGNLAIDQETSFSRWL